MFCERRRPCPPCPKRPPLTSPSVHRFQQCALDVPGLGNGEDLGMVERLSTKLAQRDAASGIGGGRFQHREKQRLRKMKAAAGGEEQSLRREQSHSAQIDLLVSTDRGGE